MTLRCAGQALSLCAGTALALAVTRMAARAQPGTGASYGARDARRCTVRVPRGAPSAAQAAQAFICGAEHDDGNGLLYLVTNVRVEVGRGRPFQYRSDAFTDVDPTMPVYPVRGGYVQYQCSRHDSLLGRNSPNANCSADDAPNAKGICFTTTFGELQCKLLDVNHTRRDHVAPPRS